MRSFIQCVGSIAQVDFDEALAEIAGVERKIHFFAMDLPHSDACFVRAHPAETAEAFELSAPPCGNRRERARFRGAGCQVCFGS